ncbi:MAG: alanine racemase [Candidatus Kapabacteria bacterium]|nr:alanine racemase [Candidatus Kapabacteria bacterium]
MRSTQAHIDTDALAWNVSLVRRRVGDRRLLGMVKANAYGHGMVQVARVLLACGVDVLGVAFVDEAVTLRRHGIASPIMVLTPTEFHEAAAVVDLGLEVVVCDVPQALRLSEVAQSSSSRVDVHVYIDTGMHREGFLSHEAVDSILLLKELPGVDCKGICTHFATADDSQSGFIGEQVERFVGVLEACTAAGITFPHIHAANTGGIWHPADVLFTMVRPGLSLYGYSSVPSDSLPLRPVMSLVSNVLSTRRIAAGESVSYGRRWYATEDTTIVTIPIGYGDGYGRVLTGKAQCLINGQRYPIVGTICMDECMVNVGDADVAVGDPVVLLGKGYDNSAPPTDIDARELAAWANTIPYEITTSVTARVPRLYTGNLAHVANGTEV